MKHVVGFFVALIVMVGLNLLNFFLLKYEIPQFFIGWISCLSYTTARDMWSYHANDIT